LPRHPRARPPLSSDDAFVRGGLLTFEKITLAIVCGAAIILRYSSSWRQLSPENKTLPR